MAYMNQEKKAVLAPGIKAVFDKYNVKGTIAVRNFSTLVVTIKSGPIDFADSRTANRDGTPLRDMSGGMTVNPYWFREQWAGMALAFLTELFTAMQQGNHNRSDIQTDYFDVGWYVDVNIGQWNKPYELKGFPSLAVL